MRERETKLAPAPGFRLPDLTGVAEGVSTAPADTLDLLATYFDTADLRLARSGASLRYRNDEGWVVKLPKSDGADDGLLSRNEHHFDGAPGAPPADALDLVLGLIRTAPVAPVTRMRTRRQRLELHGVDDDRHARAGLRERDQEDDPQHPLRPPARQRRGRQHHSPVRELPAHVRLGRRERVPAPGSLRPVGAS